MGGSERGLSLNLSHITYSRLPHVLDNSQGLPRLFFSLFFLDCKYYLGYILDKKI